MHGKETTRGDESPVRGARILVVDDDDGMRRYLRGCLEPLEARVVEASDGRAALDLLREASPSFDLVIADVVMPGIDGLALLRVIEEDPGLAALSVLFVTGESDEAGHAGRPVLRKPFNGSLLRTYVEEILREAEGGACTGCDPP